MSVVHETISLSTSVAADVADVWDAFADPAVRATWGVPDGEAMVIDHDDLRDGGRSTYRCGTPGSPEFSGAMEYVRVVPRSLVVHTDTVHLDAESAGTEPLATGLVTWTFDPEGTGTRVGVVAQVASFVGEGMIDGNRNGHRLALEQLARHFAG